MLNHQRKPLILPISHHQIYHSCWFKQNTKQIWILGLTFIGTSMDNSLQWSNLKSAETSKLLHKRKSEWGPFSLVSAGCDYYVYYIFLKGLHIFSVMQENYISPLSPTLALCAFGLEYRRMMNFSIYFINPAWTVLAWRVYIAYTIY